MHLDYIQPLGLLPDLLYPFPHKFKLLPSLFKLSKIKFWLNTSGIPGVTWLKHFI